MRVVVPYAAERPKTRLSEVLSSSERHELSRAMLDDVLAAIDAAGGDPEVLATAPVPADAPVTVDERPLTPAVNAVLEERTVGSPLAVVMSDLALATPTALRGFFHADGDVVIAPGLGSGTNALVVRHPEFRVDYHGASYLDHLRVASDVGAAVREFDSRRLAVDVDEPADLAEVLCHTDGAARDWLVDAGFELDVNGGRVGVVRK